MPTLIHGRAASLGTRNPGRRCSSLAMAHDLSVPLASDQRALISAWAVKTAMLWDYFGPKDGPRGRGPFYLPSHRADIRAARTIPENTTVWLARYGGDRWLWSSLQDASADPNDAMPDTTARAALTTIVFGRLCIQVMSHRTLTAGVTLTTTLVPGPWEACAIPIWPRTEREVVDWPPKLSLDRDVPFQAFRTRWLQHPVL